MSTSLLVVSSTSKLVSMAKGRGFIFEEAIANAESDFAKRLVHAMKHAQVRTDGALAASLSVAVRRTQDPIKAQSIQHLRTSAKSSEWTPDLARILNVNFDWLARGEGLMLTEAERTGSNVEEDSIGSTSNLGAVRRMPMIGNAQLGADGFWMELEYPVGFGDGYVDAPSSDPNAYTIRVKGDSMFPAIRSGWFVVVEPNSPLVQGEYVLVKTKDGRSMVKELLWHRDAEYALVSVNPAHGRLTISEADVEFAHFCWPVPASKWRPG